MKTEIPAAPKRKRTKRPPPSSSAADSRNSSPATSTCTEEDEDMANCLILLARGITPPPQMEKPTCRKVGVYVYECKTCNRTFPSFQALGGHRASHKRPKLAVDSIDRLVDYKLNCPVTPKPKSSPKIHECSICGSEFASGQALGGHMRRHRAVAGAGIVETPRKALGLDLDLNLPAPPEAEDSVSYSPRRFWRW